jgi:hypothetical protein
MGGIHQQHAGAGEGAHAIDVAVGHVAGDVLRVARQPDGLLHAQQATEDFFDLSLADAGLRLGLSSTDSVVISVPSPSTWIAPPSLLSGVPKHSSPR